MPTPKTKPTSRGNKVAAPAAESPRLLATLAAIDNALRKARTALLAADDAGLARALQAGEQRAVKELPDSHPRRQRALAEFAFERLYAEFVSMRPGFDAAAQQTASLLPAMGSNDLLARVLALRAFACGRDDQIERQVAVARQALGLAPADAFVGLYVHLALAGSLHWIGEFTSTALHFRPALTCARALGEPLLEAFALRNIAVAETKESRHAWEAGHATVHMAAQAEASLRGCIHYYLDKTSRRRLTYPWLCVAETLMLQGRFDDALLLYDEHLPAAQADGLLLQAAEGASRRARCLLSLQRLPAALDASDQALQWLAGYDDPDVAATVHSDRALVLTALGRDGDAAESLALAAAARATLTTLRERYRLPLLQALDGVVPLPISPAP